MNNPITSIPTEQLTYRLWKEADVKAELERQWTIKDHSRLIVLAELTNLNAASGDSIAAAERKARTSQEYKEFVQEMGEVRKELILARAKVSAVEYEIKIRLNKSFTDRVEHRGGGLVT